MSSAPEPHKGERLISQLLLEDGDLRDIVEEFVESLATRITEMKEAHQKLDWDQLTVLMHRLKGAAGSYGYPEISALCAEMEHKFRSHQGLDFHQSLEKLNAFATAAQEGLAAK
jgi:HPt (histidine-containing phosphotransfer) domain-containing protein